MSKSLKAFCLFFQEESAEEKESVTISSAPALSMARAWKMSPRAVDGTAVVESPSMEWSYDYTRNPPPTADKRQISGESS